MQLRPASKMLQVYSLFSLDRVYPRPQKSLFLSFDLDSTDSISISTFVVILVEFDKYKIWDEQACLRVHANPVSYHISSTSSKSPAQSKAVVPLAPFERDKLHRRHLSVTHPSTYIAPSCISQILSPRVILSISQTCISLIIVTIWNEWAPTPFLWLSQAPLKTAQAQKWGTLFKTTALQQVTGLNFILLASSLPPILLPWFTRSELNCYC